MFLGSFKTNNEIYQNALAFPTGFDFTVYRDAWIAANFCSGADEQPDDHGDQCCLIVLISSLAAFAFAVMDFKGKNALYLFILAGQIISAQIILIPLFSMFKSMQVLNTQWSAVIAYTAVGIPLSMLLLRNSFQEVPRDIYESTKIDGCNSFHYYLSFMLPLSKPGLASVIIYQALFAWN